MIPIRSGLDVAGLLQGLSPLGRKSGIQDFASLFAAKTGTGIPADRLNQALEAAAKEVGVSGKALQEAVWKALPEAAGAKQADDALQAALKAADRGRLGAAAMALFDLQRTLMGGTGSYDPRSDRKRGSAFDFLVGL